MININTKLLDIGLSCEALSVVLHIAKRTKQEMTAFPSISLLKKETGLGDTRINNALKELVALNIIQKSQRRVTEKMAQNNPLKYKGKVGWFASNVYHITTEFLGIYFSGSEIKEMEEKFSDEFEPIEIESPEISPCLDNGGAEEPCTENTGNKLLANSKVINNFNSFTKKNIKGNSEIEIKMNNLKDQILNHHMYPVNVANFKSNLVIPEELLETIDEKAINETVITLLNENIENFAGKFGYLGTGYKKALADYKTNTQTIKAQKELEITENKAKYYQDKEENQVVAKNATTQSGAKSEEQQKLDEEILAIIEEMKNKFIASLKQEEINGILRLINKKPIAERVEYAKYTAYHEERENMKKIGMWDTVFYEKYKMNIEAWRPIRAKDEELRDRINKKYGI